MFETQYWAEWCPHFFTSVSCPSEGHCSQCENKNQDFPASLCRPVSVDQASCRLCTGLSHASCLHYLSFYNLQMVHMLFLWSPSPTPLSIWQIYTPKTQHLPQGRLEWYQMEMFISGFSEQAEGAIGTLLLLKARLYQQQWSVGTILFSLSLVFAQRLVFWVRLFRRLKFTCLVKCALIWVFLM